MILFTKKMLDERKLDQSPFSAAGRDNGIGYLVSHDHPRIGELQLLYRPRKPAPKSSGGEFKHWGNAKWETLHLWAQSVDLDDVYGALAWLCRWSIDLPDGGCQCAPHWSMVYSANPPVLTSREALFAWTVRVHNIVNANLMKPAMPLMIAERRWRVEQDA